MNSTLNLFRHGCMAVAVVCTLQAGPGLQPALFETLYSEARQTTSDLAGASVRELLEAVASMDSSSRQAAVSGWIAANRPRIDVMENLLEALGVLGLNENGKDQLLLTYAGAADKGFSLKTLHRVLDLFSAQAYKADTLAKNGPALAVQQTIPNKNLPFADFIQLMSRLEYEGIHFDVRDLHLIPTYLKNQGQKLEFSQMHRLVRMMPSRPLKSQAAGVTVHTWTLQHAGELMNEDVRQGLQRLLEDLPSSNRLQSGYDGLSPKNQKILLAAEWKLKDLFFPTNGCIKVIEEQADASKWPALASLIIERNQHRLNSSKIQKIQSELNSAQVSTE